MTSAPCNKVRQPSSPDARMHSCEQRRPVGSPQSRAPRWPRYAVEPFGCTIQGRFRARVHLPLFGNLHPLRRQRLGLQRLFGAVMPQDVVIGLPKLMSFGGASCHEACYTQAPSTKQDARKFESSWVLGRVTRNIRVNGCRDKFPEGFSELCVLW